MWSDALEAFIGFVVLIVSCVVAWAIAHHTVATECERLGAFYVGDKVFECKRKEGDKP